jgi:tetratricopeptide (TPR) repeat protein
MKALNRDPDVADARVVLAHVLTARGETARAEALLREAVAAAERTLALAYDPRGQYAFWSDLSTRPYMRARYALVEALDRRGEVELAIEHAREILRLCPRDNMGVRYLLLSMLIRESPRAVERAVLWHFPVYTGEEDGPREFYGDSLLLWARTTPRGNADCEQTTAEALVRHHPLSTEALLVGLGARLPSRADRAAVSPSNQAMRHTAEQEAAQVLPFWKPGGAERVRVLRQAYAAAVQRARRSGGRLTFGPLDDIYGRDDLRPFD